MYTLNNVTTKYVAVTNKLHQLYMQCEDTVIFTKIRLGMWINIEIFAPLNHTLQNRHKALETFETHAFLLILCCTFHIMQTIRHELQSLGTQSKKL